MWCNGAIKILLLTLLKTLIILWDCDQQIRFNPQFGPDWRQNSFRSVAVVWLLLRLSCRPKLWFVDRAGVDLLWFLCGAGWSPAVPPPAPPRLCLQSSQTGRPHQTGGDNHGAGGERRGHRQHQGQPGLQFGWVRRHPRPVFEQQQTVSCGQVSPT